MMVTCCHILYFLNSYILRMKEYERERRLKARDLRKKAKANVDSGEDIVHSEAQVH